MGHRNRSHIDEWAALVGEDVGDRTRSDRETERAAPRGEPDLQERRYGDERRRNRGDR